MYATAATLAHTWFRLFPFRSPLLREYLFLQVLRCFSSLGCLSLAYVFNQECVDSSPNTGFPIRISPDHSLLPASRGISQVSRVLRRRLVPRHPPWTLSSLSTYIHSSRAENVGIIRIQILAVGNSKKSFCLFDLFGCQCTVEMSGFEPLTPCVQSRCSPS
jgi:hypothetical protein